MFSQKIVYTKIFVCFLVLVLSCFCLGGLKCHYSDDDDDDSTHNVNTPNRPTGQTTAQVNQAVQFQTGGSFCSSGEDVEYRFDFGDSEQSGWSKNTTQNHTYKNAGTFKVSAQARCSVSLVTSSWSDNFNITINTRLDLVSIWKDQKEDLWTVGKQGEWKIFSSGKTTKEQRISEADLYGIWGTEKKVYSCGANGTILCYENDKWQKEQTPTLENLYRISGMNANLIAVGEKGTILHSSGKTWHKAVSHTQEALYGIWIHQENSIFVVGAKGSILYYDGVSWKKWETKNTEDLYAIWGTDYNHVWAVGQKGILLYFDGVSWSKIPCPYTSDWKAVYGINAMEIYAGSNDGSLVLLKQNHIESIDSRQGHTIEALVCMDGYRKIYCIDNGLNLNEFSIK